jgi:hypothetical protein
MSNGIIGISDNLPMSIGIAGVYDNRLSTLL